jgi:hypothetical protein
MCAATLFIQPLDSVEVFKVSLVVVKTQGHHRWVGLVLDRLQFESTAHRRFMLLPTARPIEEIVSCERDMRVRYGISQVIDGMEIFLVLRMDVVAESLFKSLSLLHQGLSADTPLAAAQSLWGPAPDWRQKAA